jgi:hypothetical protein
MSTLETTRTTKTPQKNTPAFSKPLRRPYNKTLPLESAACKHIQKKHNHHRYCLLLLLLLQLLLPLHFGTSQLQTLREEENNPQKQ